MRTHPTLRCHDCCSPQPPITAAPGVVPCVRQGISLALIRSSFPRRIACRLLDSGGGEGAEVTLVRHMTQGVLSRFGRSDSDKGYDSPGPIYSFNLTTSEAPSSET